MSEDKSWPAKGPAWEATGATLTDDGRKAWDRQPGEGDSAYYCFTVYRDHGPLARSASRVVSECGRSLSLVERWRARWYWVDRARAWDAAQDEIRRREQVQESIDMGRRQATEARAISQAMMIPVRELLRRMGDIMEVEQIKRLSLGDLLVLSIQTGRVWPVAMRAERLARGAPTPDYGAFMETDDETGEASVLDSEAHLREVWRAMEEAGLSPVPKAIAPAPVVDVVETNGHVENGHA